MQATQNIDDWARENGLELGEAIYVILKYLVDDPRQINQEVRRVLRTASEQEVIDAMETAAEDLEDTSKDEVLR